MVRVNQYINSYEFKFWIWSLDLKKVLGKLMDDEIYTIEKE